MKKNAEVRKERRVARFMDLMLASDICRNDAAHLKKKLVTKSAIVWL